MALWVSFIEIIAWLHWRGVPSAGIEKAMKTYICLISFTDQGVRALKDSPKRARALRASMEAKGLNVVSQLWCAGPYDGLLVVRGDDEDILLSQLTRLATLGNVRTTSLRAFEADEFAAIVGAE